MQTFDYQLLKTYEIYFEQLELLAVIFVVQVLTLDLITYVCNPFVSDSNGISDRYCLHAWLDGVSYHSSIQREIRYPGGATS